MVRLRDLGVCVALATASCSRAEDPVEPSWRRLARGFRPAAQQPVGEWGVPAYGGDALRLSVGAGPHELVLEYTIRAEQWVRRGPRTWSAPRPIPTLLSERAQDPTLVADGDAHPLVTRSLHLNRRLQDQSLDDVVVGMLTRPGFTPLYGQVHLVLPEESEAPARTSVREGFRLGFEENGAWRVPLDDLVADAIPVLSGTAEVVRADLPPGHSFGIAREMLRLARDLRRRRRAVAG